MPKVLILVNTLTAVQQSIYPNHIHMLVHTRTHRPDIKFILNTPHRQTIDHARNQSALMALNMECTHLFFLDDDVQVQPDALIRLIDADKDVIAGLTYIRWMPFKPMVFRQKNETSKTLDLEYYEPKEELEQVFGVGFSCCLIKTDVLQALRPPYFVTIPSIQTEDVAFCSKIHEELEPKPEVWVHSGVPTGHLMMPQAVWPSNVKLWREHMEKLYPTPTEDGKGGDRTENYALANGIDIYVDSDFPTDAEWEAEKATYEKLEVTPIDNTSPEFDRSTPYN